MTTRRERSTAEWTTFAVSCGIVLILLAAIAVQAVGPERPAAPVAMVDGPIERRGTQFHIPVTVTNRGDETAEAVEVVAASTIGGQTIEGQQMVDFLAGGDEHELVFVFDEDPRGGQLTVRVTGFSVP